MCETIDHLKRLAASSDRGLAGGAASALLIISDIQADGIKGMDISTLNSLLEPLYIESNAPLFEHLKAGATDCGICAAIQANYAPRHIPKT